MAAKRLMLMGLSVVTLASCAGMMPVRDAWYTRHYFIMQDFERQAYRGLSEAGRAEFQQLFWTARSPQAKELFDQRMEFVLTTYKRENSAQPWNTDRGRIYLLNGAPADIESRHNDDWAARVVPGGGGVSYTDRSGEDISATTLEVWTYPYEQFFVQYGFIFQPPNKWPVVQVQGGSARYKGELEAWNRSQVFGPADEESYKQKLAELKAIK